MGTAFKLHYPSIDWFTQRLTELGKGSLVHKIDLSRAFRQLKVDPLDYPLLCLEWQGLYYVDGSYSLAIERAQWGVADAATFFAMFTQKKAFTQCCILTTF